MRLALCLIYFVTIGAAPIAQRPAAAAAGDTISRDPQKTIGETKIAEPKTRARAYRALTGTPWSRLTSDLTDYRRFWRAVGRFSIFDAEGQRRSVRAGGLSALLSQTWLPSYYQRAMFPREHFEEFTESLRLVERTVQSIIATTPLDPPPLSLFNKPRGFGAPFDYRTLIENKFTPLLA